jgi:YD repeat-containing protein
VQGGLVVSLTYLNARGQPALHKNGFSSWTARYDDHGNRTEQTYFGLDGKPALHKEGNAGWTARYDERGNVTEWAYFGVDGKPALLKAGFSRWTARYDQRGNRTEIAFFDAKGKPTTTAFGHARVRTRYNTHGRPVEQTFYRPDGQAIYRLLLDDQGPTQRILFGAHGRPIPTRVTVTGVVVGGAGARAGLRRGDVLDRYDGAPVTSSFLLIRRVKTAAKGGAPRSLRVLRGGKPLTFEVPPGPLGINVADMPASSAP